MNNGNSSQNCFLIVIVTAVLVTDSVVPGDHYVKHSWYCTLSNHASCNALMLNTYLWCTLRMSPFSTKYCYTLLLWRCLYRKAYPNQIFPVRSYWFSAFKIAFFQIIKMCWSTFKKKPANLTALQFYAVPVICPFTEVVLPVICNLR